MKYSVAAAFFALVAFVAAAPVAVSDPGDTAPVMSNGDTTVPFANTGNPGNAMDAADAAAEPANAAAAPAAEPAA